VSADSKPTILHDGQPLTRFLTYRLSRVQAKLNAQANALLRDHAGMSLSKWRVLALVSTAGTTRLSDLARIAALDKGLVSRNVKALVAEGLMSSKQDDIDNRVQHLSLTAKGQALFDRILPRMQQRQAHLRAALDAHERDVLDAALDKLELAAEWRGDDA
jgi:DNA-binding MarR family transcriptional regulator